MKEILCELKGVYKKYPGVIALRNVDLCIYRGEVCALLGKNGAGKSTLIKILSGAISPTEGKVYFKGSEIEEFSTKAAFERGISVLYQELHLLPNLTVKENMFVGRLPVKKGCVDYKEMKKEAQRILQSLHVDIDPNMYVEDLGTVQKQLVSIATALSRKAELFIFDEPSAILSMKELQVLYKSIKKLKEMNKGIIYVTHTLEEIPIIADRVVVLRDGVKVLDEYLENVEMEEIETSIIGKKKESRLRKVEQVDFSRMRLKLELEDLWYKDVLRGINLKFFEDIVYCIYGLEGSGKRELGKILFGDLRPTRGTIKINGEPVNLSSPRDGIRNGIGYMVDERASEGLLLGKSVSDNIILPSLDKVRGKVFLDEEKIGKLVSRRIDELKIVPPNPFIKVGELSGGNQQKVLLAKWLEIGSILVLVDPTRGLDIETKGRLIELIRRFRRNRTIIVIPSEIEDGLAVGDWVIILREGEVVKNERITSDTNRKELLMLAGLEF